jgi:hypothetical protein
VLGQVGIEPRRAHLVTKDKVTFPRAPLQSRKVGFPDSGFRLGFPREAFPRQVKLKRSLARMHPNRAGLPPSSSLKLRLLRLSSLTIQGPPSGRLPLGERWLLDSSALSSSPGHAPTHDARCLAEELFCFLRLRL